MLRELITEVLRRNIETAKCAIIWRRSGKAHIRTKVVVTAQTSLAVTARSSWLDRDLISHPQGLALLSYCGDDSGGLVAETHGRLEDEGADCAVDPVVYVGTADSGELDGDLDIAVVLDLWDRALFVCDVVWLVEDEGEVLCAVSEVRLR